MYSCNNAIALFNDKVKGYVKFHQCNKNRYTMVEFNLSGLEKNKKYACHIHEYGDISEGCKSLGMHWNPYNKNHGNIYIDIENSHAGDLLNNIITDNNGNYKKIYNDPRINLFGDNKYTIYGRSVVIHKGIDDLGLGNNRESKMTGNSGERLDCAIIGYSKQGKLNI